MKDLTTVCSICKHYDASIPSEPCDLEITELNGFSCNRFKERTARQSVDSLSQDVPLTQITVQFCEAYQKEHGYNVDWVQSLKITRVGGEDHDPIHEATLTLDGVTATYSGHCKKKEAKAYAIKAYIAANL